MADKVRLIYPNNWRETVLIGSDTDCFDWFLCSSKIYDEKLNLYYIKISPKAKFYNNRTKQIVSVTSKDVKLLLYNNFNFSIGKGYDGIAYRISEHGVDQIVCTKALFWFKKGLLTESKED